MLILASNSPRRRQIISWAGWAFDVLPMDVDESRLPGEHPADHVLRLAQSKAQAAARHARPDDLVIGSDTIVVDGEAILGKPSGPQEARAMLTRLRGREHQVFTALAVISPASGRVETDLCITQVPMRTYSDAEMDAYIASGDPLDKAGAYAIQHAGFHPVETLRGCFASVMGLPLCHLTRTLGKFGVSPAQDPAKRCMTELDYACPVSATILRGEQTG